MIEGCSDNDVAQDVNDRKSTSRQIFFLGNSAITWSTMKQNVVALSSYEAEYISASAAACQDIWTARFIEELLKIKVKPITSGQQVDHRLEQNSYSTQLQQAYRNETSFHL